MVDFGPERRVARVSIRKATICSDRGVKAKAGDTCYDPLHIRGLKNLAICL
jgi:hypothetical protein